MIFIREQAMRKVLRGYAKDKDGNLLLIGTMPCAPVKKTSMIISSILPRCGVSPGASTALNVIHGAANVWSLSINSGQTAPSGLIVSAALDLWRKSSHSFCCCA
jgi:hypothetical protein